MPPATDSLAFHPCEGLYDFTLQFGSEQESLPQDCQSTTNLPAHSANVSLRTYRQNLRNPDFVPTALRVALVVGSLLFTLNHGSALLKNDMTRSRWLSGFLSFVTPYMVSIYSQTHCQLKHK